MRRVIVSGMGIVCPIGGNCRDTFAALRAGRSGIRAMPTWENVSGLHCRIGGVIDGLDPKAIARSFRRTMARDSILASFAAMEAVASAQLKPADLVSPRTGLAAGSTCGAPSVLEQFFNQFRDHRGVEGIEGTTFMKIMGHSVAANLAALLNLSGQVWAPTAACATSTQALILGLQAIRSGVQDIMICGGADELHPTSAGVFDILAAASRAYNADPAAAPRPFDRDRDGLVLSEAAGILVLEELEHARARNAPICGEILGGATTGNGHHLVQPDPQSMLGCLRAVLADARVHHEDLGYINAHATGTRIGDAAEAQTLCTLVGDHVPVSSTKGATGHTLAACGAIETIFCLQMLRERILVPTRNLQHVDPECTGLRHLLVEEPMERLLALNCNFAFGGICAGLVLAPYG